MEIYSPVQYVTYKDFSFYLKRDDLIDPYISGNKWRKLKWILIDAKHKQKSHLVTFGGTYSNHLVATAAAAARHKLKATGFVRGEEVTNELLMLCKLYGMKLIFVNREAYKNKTDLFSFYFAGDEGAYFIDEGGAGALAVKGCAEIIDELPAMFDHLFCAAGTGTTCAGLLKGINAKKLDTQLHLISVLKGGDFFSEYIEEHLPNLNQLHVHTAYHFGGYAKTSEELLKFIADFAMRTGILLDPVYTGKMIFALYDLFKKKFFDQHDKICALHTGGLLGVFGMKDKLDAILR